MYLDKQVHLYFYYQCLQTIYQRELQLLVNFPWVYYVFLLAHYAQKQVFLKYHVFYHHFIISSSTKELSIHLTKILSAVKEGHQKYGETVYSRSGINHMWILKNSKDLLDNLKSRSFSQVSSIKTFDFSNKYTTLPHDKLNTRLKETIYKAFSHRNYGS